jgi:flavin reductase (DIM6/NTAB) family NADH-FMN oxidoreductase RutF
MNKKKMGAVNLLYPTPVTLVGTMVNNKPNIITIAHIGIIEYSPVHLISISMNKRHYSNAGMQENKVFSINLPSVELIEITDYCGIYSGRKIDKGDLFDLFYGELENAPMIETCSINMECRVSQTIDIHKHNIYIGEIVNAYCDEAVMRDGLPDLSLVNPILFSFYDKHYWSVGNHVANAWNAGKEFKAKQKAISR